MAESETYESYPASGVILCNIFDAVIALLGAYILWPACEMFARGKRK